MWQEIFDNGGTLHPETIIEIWKGWGRGWQYELDLVSKKRFQLKVYVFRRFQSSTISRLWVLFQVTSEGHYAILSAPWYLNYIKYGSDWVKFYQVDPLDFGGNSTQKEYVLGGEVKCSHH